MRNAKYKKNEKCFGPFHILEGISLNIGGKKSLKAIAKGPLTVAHRLRA